MRYWLLREEQYAQLSPDQRNGIAVIVSNDYNNLLRIENLNHSQNLTPWLRRREAVALNVPEKLRRPHPVRIPPATLREYIRLARAGARRELSVIVHPYADKLLLYVESEGRISAHTLPSEPASLRLYLTRLKQRFGRLRISLIGNELRWLGEIMALNLDASVVFFAEKLPETSPGRQKPLRDILIITNLHGAPLPWLGKNLEFWARGLSGFRFRHLFGKLDPGRIENFLAQRPWDMAIYRGHATLQQGRLFWLLQDWWPVPERIATNYLHLACVEDAATLALRQLPARTVILPWLLLEDFDDAAFVREFLVRQQKTASVLAALRAIQQQFPHFAGIVW